MKSTELHSSASHTWIVMGRDESKPEKYAGIDFGKYHALVIGIDEYKHLPKLQTAVNDAEAVADVLKNDYGFDVNLLRNAKHSVVIDALDDYEAKLGINDNLLIYYAGHGHQDANTGYWIPVDGADPSEDDDSYWISSERISNSLIVYPFMSDGDLIVSNNL